MSYCTRILTVAEGGGRKSLFALIEEEVIENKSLPERILPSNTDVADLQSTEMEDHDGAATQLTPRTRLFQETSTSNDWLDGEVSKMLEESKLL
jgi:hypothetical protein